MTIVDAAMLIAIEAHGGTRNKHDGEMYSLHLARVWMNVRNAGGDHIQQAIAWLHDSVEDTDLTLKEIGSRLVMFDATSVGRVVAGVRAMTKLPGESNEDYYRRCKENDDGAFVKLRGDLVDNFRRNHQIEDPDTLARMTRKYSLGMDILT